MKKYVKIIVAIVLIIIAVVVCYFCFGKKDEINVDVEAENQIANENEENIVEENIVDENEVDNEVVEQEISNKDTQVPAGQEPPAKSNVYESDSDVGSTDKKQEAINLVKETWGEDNTVTFRCDSVTSNGEYIIAVISTETASVRNYFIVNLDNKTVTVDY